MYFYSRYERKAERGAELGGIQRLCYSSYNLTFLIVSKGGHPGS